MPGSYQLVCESDADGNVGATGGHLYLSPSGNVKPSKDEERLVTEAEKLAKALRKHLANNSPQFRQRFVALLKLAQTGLVGDNANAAVAQAALDTMKTEMIHDEGQDIRKKTLVVLLVVAAIFACLFLFLGFFAKDIINGANVTDRVLAQDDASADAKTRAFQLATGLQRYAWMLGASMIGLWAAFAMRRNFTFEQLFLPEADLLGPVFRAVFVIIATGLLALLCSKKITGFYLGTFTTENSRFRYRKYFDLRDAMWTQPESSCGDHYASRHALCAFVGEDRRRIADQATKKAACAEIWWTIRPRKTMGRTMPGRVRQSGKCGDNERTRRYWASDYAALART
jgi:hypothetical protein